MAKEREPVSGIRPSQENKEAQALEREVQDLVRQEEALARRVQSGDKTIDAETLARLSRELPRLIQRTLQKIEASVVYRTFKLAGRDYVVQDRREEKTAEKGGKEKPDEGKRIKEESKKPIEEMILMRGKLSPAREKDYENYLADPTLRGPTVERQAAAERLLKLFSRFEAALLKRFEGGEEIAFRQPEGEKSFLKKTAEQWHNFFSHFMGRTVKRTASLENIREWFFRGFVEKSARATVISDLAMAGGQMEKFARIRLTSAETLAAFFAKLEPGARISKEELRRFLAGDLEYLAIKQGEGSEAVWARAPLKGKFLESAAAEAMVAGDLGVQLEGQAREKERILREMVGRKKGTGWGGGGGGFFGEKEGGDAPPQEQFIPWWQYGLQKPAIRWGLTAFLFVILAGILIGLSALF